MKPATYTPEMTQYIITEYKSDPTPATVERLAAELERPRRGIISKLAIAGIYQKPERLSKDGTKIVTREQLVEEIESALGITAPTLVKAGKLDLKKLREALYDPLALRAHLVDLEYEDDN
jgi:hypothetical protein